MTILPIFKPSARIKDRSPAAVGRASRVASRVSRRRSAVSGAAPAERDFRRRNEDEGKEEEEDFAGFISSAPDTSAAWPGVTSGRGFSYSSVVTEKPRHNVRLDDRLRDPAARPFDRSRGLNHCNAIHRLRGVRRFRLRAGIDWQVRFHEFRFRRANRIFAGFLLYFSPHRLRVSASRRLWLARVVVGFRGSQRGGIQSGTFVDGGVGLGIGCPRNHRRPLLLPLCVLAVDINDEAVRVRQQESFVARKVIYFQYDPRAPWLKFGNANFLQEAIIHVEGLAD